MKNLTLILLVLISIFSFTACKEDLNPNVTPVVTDVSIVGQWKFSSLGAITNIKTYEATLDEIKKFSGNNTAATDSIASMYAYEFKSDSTYIAGEDRGKWRMSSDKKSVILTSTQSVGFDGKYQVITYQIASLSNTDLKLAYKKLVADANGEIETDGFTDFIYLVVGYYVIQIKGNAVEANAATSLQTTISLKR
jgi:hypothetical protein